MSSNTFNEVKKWCIGDSSSTCESIAKLFPPVSNLRCVAQIYSSFDIHIQTKLLCSVNDDCGYHGFMSVPFAYLH